MSAEVFFRTHIDGETIDPSRFLARFDEISSFGATGDGGLDRQALSKPDIEAHRTVIDWFRRPGYRINADAVGNIFITRAGTDGTAAPLVTGSHLDSQPTGGRFDGALGVVAAAEVLASLDDRAIATRRPIQLAIWMNEEGCRFSPVTMGSAVFSGSLPSAVAGRAVDREGASFARELDKFFLGIGVKGTTEPLSRPWRYLELHIEQGPILECEHSTIGVVTGVQGTIQYRIDIEGQEAHAGTTPPAMRRDAFKAARTLIDRIESKLEDGDCSTRFTVGRCDIHPSAPNTIAGRTSFTVDLRHPDASTLERHDVLIHKTIQDYAGPCGVTLTKLINTKPVAFDLRLTNAIDAAAERRGLARQHLLSGATHDAARIAGLCPAAMIFVPCRNGLSHCPEEFASETDMIAGVSVLHDVVLAEAQA
ncbi:M20 family metallo-hydrolase [Mesorhizobium sp. KR9-304]|uniref:M20 family metallo-hydrolase n=1 Tax=Mesorhizobium sp. KR9-304 TaxID=3156614 RepID=UPI0032B53CBE